MKYLNKIVEVDWEDASFIHDFNYARLYELEEMLTKTKTYGRVIFENAKLIVIAVTFAEPTPDCMIIPKKIITSIKILEVKSK